MVKLSDIMISEEPDKKAPQTFTETAPIDEDFLYFNSIHHQIRMESLFILPGVVVHEQQMENPHTVCDLKRPFALLH